MISTDTDISDCYYHSYRRYIHYVNMKYLQKRVLSWMNILDSKMSNINGTIHFKLLAYGLTSIKYWLVAC